MGETRDKAWFMNDIRKSKVQQGMIYRIATTSNDNMSVGGNTFSDVESTAGGDNRQPMRKNYVLMTFQFTCVEYKNNKDRRGIK